MKKRTGWLLTVFCAFAVCALGGAVLCAPRAVFTLHLPEPASLTQITLTHGAQKTALTQGSDIEALLALVNGPGRTTREESIQDAPVNTGGVIQVDCRFAEGASTLFLYERRGRFYIEQPYNGVYRIEESEYVSVESFFA